jgi:hypothetical protein
MNVVQIMYTHEVNAKMTPVETYRNLGRKDRGEQWQGEFKLFHLLHAENFCKCCSVPPPS